MSDDTVLVGIDGAVATVTLNRPEVHNAFDDALIARLTDALEDLVARDTVRVVVLAGRGKSFCAGADLAHMKKAAGFSEAENIADAQALAHLLMVLGGLPKPTVALVQGPAYGGGVGLVSACDIALAAERASFALTEVRLGLIPAVISPFVVRAIGESHSRRFMLTGERFDAETALRIGLVHEVVPVEGLEARGAEVVEMLMQCSPDAHRRAKALIDAVSGRPIDEALADDVARRIAAARASNDGKEGAAAFLEKRSPQWRPEQSSAVSLNLLKLAVGIDGVDHLRAVQAARLQRLGRLIHVTRFTPRRAEEILAGGSMYWVIRRRIRVRQRILAFDRHETQASAKPKCAIVMDPELFATDPVHRRPHQGWRYLEAADAPRDLGPVGTVSLPEDAFPPEMAAELRALGLL